MAVRAGADSHRARTGGLEPLGPVALGQAQDAETRAVALLGVRAVGEDRLHQRRRPRPDARRPVDQPRRRPGQVLLMRLRHVLGERRMAAAFGASGVGGHALAPQEDLDRRPGEAQLHLLVGEGVGHGVVMAIELHVVVEVHARRLPLGVDEALRGKRLQCRSIDALEELLPAGAVGAHRAGVEIDEQLPDPCIQGGQREEDLVAQTGQDPALGYLDSDLDLGLGVSRQLHPIARIEHDLSG